MAFLKQDLNKVHPLYQGKVFLSVCEQSSSLAVTVHPRYYRISYILDLADCLLLMLFLLSSFFFSYYK